MRRVVLAFVIAACGERREEKPPPPPPAVHDAAEALTPEPSANWLRDLPPVEGKPTYVGGAERTSGKYPVLLGAFALDKIGDIYVIDDSAELNEIVVQAPSGPPRLLVRAQKLPRPEEFFDIVVDDESVYFSSNVRSFDGSKIGYAVRVVPKKGGVARVILKGDLPKKGLASDLRADESSLYVQRTGEDGEFVGSIARFPRTGGDATVIAKGLEGFWPWAIDDAFLYFEAPGKKTPDGDRPADLLRRPKTGGSDELVAHVKDSIGNIELVKGTDEYVVYDERGEKAQTLHRIRIPGGEREEITKFDGFPGGFCVDGPFVYWAVLGDDTAQLWSRSIGSRVMSTEIKRGKPFPRGARWRVIGGVRYVSLSNGVERTKL